MKASFILLVLADLVLMAITAIVGFTVHGTDGFVRHFLLGLLTGLFTCLVHSVTFSYFIVQSKIIRQLGSPRGPEALALEEVGRLKSRALRLSLLGILAMLVAMALGAAIETQVAPLFHLMASAGAMAVNVIAFVRQYSLIEQCGRVFHRALGNA